jgi:RNA polymerase sigma factor (sigma-70 family)
MTKQGVQAPVQPFRSYERLLWKLLSKLAQQGYVVHPMDGRDLIADFYADVWGGLVDRYDASRGEFTAYLVSAFFRFARRRIIQAQSWRSRLVDVEQLASRAGSVRPPEEAAELANVRSLMDRLGEPERSILRGRLQGESERTLHDRLGISRYRVREFLIDAIGKVASALGEVRPKEPADAKVAIALWKDGRTIRDTAALLDLSVSDVRDARERNVCRILNALNHLSLQGSHAMNDSSLELLKNAMLSPGNEDLLAQVRASSAKIREAVEDGELDWSEEDVSRLEEQNEWVARVYEAFAGSGSDTEEDEDDGLTRAIEQVRENKDREIATAFSAALETLPEEFREWERWFSKVPAAPKDYQRYLLKQVVVIESDDHGQELIKYGMTPSTFAEAARGIELLANRLLRVAVRSEPLPSQTAPALVELYAYIREHIKSGDSPSVIVTLRGERTGCIPRELLLSQMRGTPGCPPEAAEPLTGWMIHAARYKPFLFAGYQASNVDEMRDAIRLTHNPIEEQADLTWRWGRHTQEELQSACVTA